MQYYTSFKKNVKDLPGILFRYSGAYVKITDTEKNFQSKIGRTYGVNYLEICITNSFAILSDDLDEHLELSFYGGLLFRVEDNIDAGMKEPVPQFGLFLNVKLNNNSKAALK